MIVDEAQRIADLPLDAKTVVDSNQREDAQFVLTGTASVIHRVICMMPQRGAGVAEACNGPSLC